MKCLMDGCGEPAYAKWVCEKHYKRLLRTGVFTDSDRSHGSLEVRFRRKFEEGTKEECWEWFGGKNGKGYGFIQQGGKGSPNLLAHRLSYRIYKGPIPDGFNVLHNCDNPSCVNPNHLRAGTQSENIIESYAKGRKILPSPGKGEDNPRSKLTLEQAKFIKANPQMRLIDLAREYGLSLNCIRGVRIGRTWKDA